MQIRAWQRSLSATLTLLAGAVITACAPGPPPAPQPDPGCAPGVAPSTREELDVCLRGLTFDSTEEASDRQPLTVIEKVPSQGSQPCPGDASGKLSCRYGPLATIEPLRGAQRYSEEDLRQGRIIARIRVPAGEKEGYRKYGLLPGQDTYWWVQTDNSDTTGTSVFLTRGQDGKLQQVKRPLHRQRYDAGYYQRYGETEDEGRKWWKAIARWIWTLDDETATAKCSSGSCK